MSNAAITMDALKAAFVLDEHDFLVEDLACCQTCADPFEPDQQALEVYEPMQDAGPRRAIVTIHLRCYQGEEVHS